jgi:LDH2 family malate/lactate/ureidoglycolate dehydrogenase
MNHQIVSEACLLRIGQDLLNAAGCPPDHSRRAIEALVWANLRGVDSHGVRLLAQSVDRVLGKGATANPDIHAITSAGALELWDGDFGLGLVVGSVCMERACDLASENGVGWVSVRKSNHFSAAGAYAAEAVARGYVALSLSNSSLNLALHGGVDPVIGNNPMAIGVPTRHFPMILDMSAGISSGGRAMMMRKAGIPVPDDWYVSPQPDDDKRPVMRPMGALEGVGAKGSGLAVIVEALTGVLAAGGILSDLMVGVGYSTDIPDNSAHTMVALDPQKFLPSGVFEERIERLITELQAATPAPGVDEVRMPGERAWRETLHRRREGIPVMTETVTAIEETAHKLGVAIDW